MSKWKALHKTVSFRMLAVLATIGVAWGMTGNYQLSATIGVVQGGVNSVLYYAHEKAWERQDQIEKKEESK